MLKVILGAIEWLVDKLFGGPKVSTAQQLGQTQSQVDQEAQANAQLAKAAAASNAATVERVRDDPTSDNVTTDPKAAINTAPGAIFRDS